MSGFHITRNMCSWVEERHFTRDMCFPGSGTHIPSDERPLHPSPGGGPLAPVPSTFSYFRGT